MEIFRKPKLSSQEIWLGFTTIYWITGIATLLLPTFYGGKRVITTRPFKPTSALEIINKYNVTTIIISPTLLVSLYSCEERESRYNSMRIISVGGLPVTQQICERAKVLFPNCEICPTYACSEGGILSMNLSNIKSESVGHLYGNVEMKARHT